MSPRIVAPEPEGTRGASLPDPWTVTVVSRFNLFSVWSPSSDHAE